VFFHCTSCGGQGHRKNDKKCPNYVGKRWQVCGFCHKYTDHNKLTCPNPPTQKNCNQLQILPKEDVPYGKYRDKYNEFTFKRNFLDDDDIENFDLVAKKWKAPYIKWQERAHWVTKKYGDGVTQKERRQWTFGTYIKMYVEQKERCRICDRKIAPLSWGGLSGKHTAQVDHNHATTEIRALLCYRCNMTIGSAQESRGVLAKMIAYLDDYGNNSDVEVSSSIESDVDVLYY